MQYTRKFTLSSLLKYPSCDNCHKTDQFFFVCTGIFSRVHTSKKWGVESAYGW